MHSLRFTSGATLCVRTSWKISIVGQQFKMTAQHRHLLAHSPSLGLESNPGQCSGHVCSSDLHVTTAVTCTLPLCHACLPNSTKIYTFFFFKKKFLADTCPFLGPLVPLFWISGDVSSGFQSQSGFCLIRYFFGGECNVHSPRFTSGATLANLLAAGKQPVTSPHACAEVGLGSDSNVQPHEQKTNACYHCASDPAHQDLYLSYRYHM